MRVRQWRLFGIFPAIALGISGCATINGQPELKSAYIMPDNLKPGDTAVITVEIEDRYNVVARVEGVVKEDRTITFTFEDNGVPPDEKADDGIWTIQVDVPFNAPPGTFEFEVAGYTADGDVVVVEDDNFEAAPLKTSIGLEIDYPDPPESDASVTQ